MRTKEGLLRERMHPLWRKAPLVLLRFPALFVAVAAAALLLALAVASGPLFVSSAASSALADELEDATRFGAGAAVVYESVSARLHPAEADPNKGIDRLNATVVSALRHVPHVEGPILTVLGATVTPGTAPGVSSQRPIRLLAKTDSLAHVTKIVGRDGDGFWIADEAAQSMGLEPGDDLYLTFEDGATRTVQIDGIYRALWKQPLTPYWRSLSHLIYEREPGRLRTVGGPPPTFLIGDREQVAELTSGRGLARLQLRWEWPLESTSLTLDEAERLERRLRVFQHRTESLATRIRVTPSCKGCPAFRAPEVSYSSLLSTAISVARQTVSTLRGPADLLTAAGVLVALAVVGAAAAFAMARRRVEATVLFARGTAPAEIGARAALEALVPVFVGALAGLGLAVALTIAVGPGAVARPALVAAAKAAGLVIPSAALLIGLISALVFVLSRERHAARSPLPVSIPWELPVLAASAFFLYELRTKGAFAGASGPEAARPSLAVLLFPLLFTAGLAGLAARGLRRGFGRLRAASSLLPSAPYLAVHRLAAAGSLGVLLATASAVSLGTFVYAQAVVRSLEETVEAKSLLFVGSDVQGLTDYDREIPDAFPLPATKVTKLVERGTLDNRTVDILAVDTTTIVAVAYFEDGWSDRPFADVVRALEPMGGPRLRVVVAGGGPSAPMLVVGATRIPIEVVSETVAFPGMSLRRPLVVADRAAFEQALDSLGAPNPLNNASAETQIWVRGETQHAVRVLQTSTLRPFPIVTAEQVRENPHIRSVSETFSYLKALGLAAALLAVAGAVLYLQARRRNRVISYALARRMGLSAGRHQFALSLELGTMLVASFVIGAVLALVAARLVIVELDAPAELPGGPLFRTPWVLIGGALAGLIAASALGALIADRRAAHANVAEVIRAGE
jgi:putative ABC transport system permease protein